ncbi:hypothetical protein FW755_12500 [Lonepinella koalarum]|uniref:hypothetical protein n=1 Tax=Lonepinella TaxID=53416 RepID=UPI0011E446D8|nr:hypothetical protein [Lonepinella koalarum]TYG33301.1 hypothetical protein FW755_12500 [Lonepinella koalarum]
MEKDQLKQFIVLLKQFIELKNADEIEQLLQLLPKHLTTEQNIEHHFYHSDRWFLLVQLFEDWAEENEWFLDFTDIEQYAWLDDLPELFAYDVKDDMTEKEKQAWLGKIKEYLK